MTNMRAQLSALIWSITTLQITSLTVYLPAASEERYIRYHIYNQAESTRTDKVPEDFEKRFYCKRTIKILQGRSLRNEYIDGNGLSTRNPPQHLIESDLDFSEEAFTNWVPPNVVNRVKFKMHSDLSTAVNFNQIMYPCYCKHKVVRSSLLLDDYADLYYISFSTTPSANSITVYRREKQLNPNEDWLRPYYMLEGMRQLPPVPVNRQVEDEAISARLDTDVSYNNDEAEVEFIYIREMLHGRKQSQPDKLAQFTSEQVKELCIGTVNSNEKSRFDRLGTFASTQSGPDDTKNMVFKHHSGYNAVEFQQTAFPCIRFNTNPEDQSYRTTLWLHYVSSGPRPASVIIYKYDIIGSSHGYRPLKMIENLPGSGRSLGFSEVDVIRV